MVYKAVEFPTNPAGNAISDRLSSQRNIVSSAPCRLSRSRACRSALWLALSADPGAGAERGKAGHAGGAPGGARFLGSAAAAGPARSVAPDRDPVPDRNRLSAVQLHRPRRQSGRLQRRSGAAAVRRDQGHLHHPDAAVRDAARRAHQQPRRCHHRLARGDAADARAARFHRSLLPRAGAVRVAARRGDAGNPSRISRRQEGRRHRRHLARGLSEGDVHRRRAALLSQ